MDISFKRFSKEYWCLFLIALFVPLFSIGGYCFIYRKSCLDETIWATIISGVVSYVGTIAWGIFIFYDSWQRRIEQDYKNRPIVRIHADLSDREPYNYQMYDRSEVSCMLKEQVGIYDHTNSYDKSHVIKYIRVVITNFGQLILSDLSLIDVNIVKDKTKSKQGNYGFLSFPGLAQTLSYKEEWSIFVAIDETLFNKLPEGYKNIEIYLKFKYDILSTYIAKLVIHTSGIGTYGQEFVIYDASK